MIDLAPLVNQVVIPLAVPALASVGTWALAAIAGHFHIKIQDSQRALVNEVLTRAINYAASKAPATINATTGSAVADVAAAYVASHVPGALRSLGVTPDGLRQMVEARLPQEYDGLTTPPF